MAPHPTSIEPHEGSRGADRPHGAAAPRRGPTTRETLRAVAASAETHAAYPTALLTLCSIRTAGLAEVPGNGPPTCDICHDNAERLNLVDHSAPREWFPRAENVRTCAHLPCRQPFRILNRPNRLYCSQKCRVDAANARRPRP